MPKGADAGSSKVSLDLPNPVVFVTDFQALLKLKN